MSQVADLETEIRDLLTNEPRDSAAPTNRANWYKIVACLDTIGDTEEALDAFLRIQDRAGFGERYLAIYGVMQALFLEQDAVEHLAEALRFPYKPDEALRAIREIRNDSIGHPTRRGPSPGKSFNAIARVSMSCTGFSMLTTDRGTAMNTYRQVDVPDLISQQRVILSRSLAVFLAELKAKADVKRENDT